MKLHLRATPDYDATLARLTDRGDDDLDRVAPTVTEILHAVRTRGDEALREYSLKYDGAVPSPFVYGPDEMARALAALDPALAAVLRLSADRITACRWAGACDRSRGSACTRRAARRGTRRAC